MIKWTFSKLQNTCLVGMTMSSVCLLSSANRHTYICAWIRFKCQKCTAAQFSKFVSMLCVETSHFQTSRMKELRDKLRFLNVFGFFNGNKTAKNLPFRANLNNRKTDRRQTYPIMIPFRRKKNLHMTMTQNKTCLISNLSTSAQDNPMRHQGLRQQPRWRNQVPPEVLYVSDLPQ